LLDEGFERPTNGVALMKSHEPVDGKRWKKTGKKR